MFLTVWLYWVLFPVAHRALISPGSARLMCCSHSGIVCPLCSVSVSWVATDLTQDPEIKSKFVCLLWWASWELQARLTEDLLTSLLRSDQLFCDLENSSETGGGIFTRDFLHFSHSVGPSVIIERFWCFYWGPCDFVYAIRCLGELDQSCWICICLRQKLPQILPQKGLRHLWYPSVFALSVSRGGCQLKNLEFVSFSFIILCLLIRMMVTLCLYLLVAEEGKSLQKTFFIIIPVLHFWVLSCV